MLNGADSPSTTFTAPSLDTETTLTFMFTATDNDGASNTDTVSITITPEPANQIPMVNAGADQSIDSGVTVTLSGNASGQ